VRLALEGVADIRIVGEADCFAQSMPALLTARPDIVLVEWPLPENEVPAQCRDGKMTLLMFGAEQTAQTLYSVMAVGAVGFLPKDADVNALLAAVRRVVHGERLWTPEQLALIMDWQQTVWRRWQELTPRERHVLRLLVQGVGSTKALAEQLCVAEKTVEKHVCTILDKLGVESRLGAVVWVIQNGILAFVEAEDR
jgi:DNA-binding NarL/FixJ family response regulator